MIILDLIKQIYAKSIMKSILSYSFLITAFFCFTALEQISKAEPPHASYIFPAGGQRGTTIEFLIGGHYLYEGSDFEMHGSGLDAPKRVDLTDTVWFEGPFVPKPLSQKEEDYPKDYNGRVTIKKSAKRGNRYWHVWNSQGITPLRPFVIGDLPEIVEKEIDGAPIPTEVKLPVTINGRIFPREDVDIWTFSGNKGELIHCDVMATRLGSPLDARLELHDANGLLLADNDDHNGKDSFLQHLLPADGPYSIHITDVNYHGLQNYIYRLTVSVGPRLETIYPLGGRRGHSTTFSLTGQNLPKTKSIFTIPSNASGSILYRPPAEWSAIGTVQLDVEDVPEYLELENKPSEKFSQVVKLPAVLNGRISSSGEKDRWQFSAKKGDKLEFDLWANRLGSPLDSTIDLINSKGDIIASADDMQKGETDSKLSFNITHSGKHTIVVSDRFASRGGSNFTYRLKAKYERVNPDFQLELSKPYLILERGSEAIFKVKIKRLGGFDGPIQLKIKNLPEHVSVKGTIIAKGKTENEITFKADKDVKINRSKLSLSGEAKINDHLINHLATGILESTGEKVSELYLSVTVPTPFKFTTQFEQKFASRGSVYLRHYELVRNGFVGPVEISMADRQVRHRQGVSGPTIKIPAGDNHFSYPLQLSPFMEIGRTSRTNLMAVGIITDPDGTRHTVSFTTFDVTVQIITLTDPGRLSLSTQLGSVLARPGTSIEIPVKIGRIVGLTGPVTVKLKPPKHIKGLSGKPVTIPTDKTTGLLKVDLASGNIGPFNLPVMLVATMTDNEGLNVIAHTYLSFVRGTSNTNQN
jgi:hypothetical protein